MASTPKISLSLGVRIAGKLPDQHSNGLKRPHVALHDSDDEGEQEGKHHDITHFDSAGATNAKDKRQAKPLLVIPLVESGQRKKQRSLLPSQSAEAAEAAAAEARRRAEPVSYGLNVSKKENEPTRPPPEAPAADEPREPAAALKKRTLEEEALADLLGQKRSNVTVIPALTEEEVFQREYTDAPAAPTESDYAAVPIEDFGAAMLRGMGWKDGEAIGRNKGQVPPKPRTLERRPELLGVGAKSEKALGIELGEWGKQAKKHERKINMAYAPVMLRHKKTGHMISEQEMLELSSGRPVSEKGEKSDPDRVAIPDRDEEDGRDKRKASRNGRRDDSDGYTSRSTRRRRSSSRERSTHRNHDDDSERRRQRRAEERYRRDYSDDEGRSSHTRHDRHRDSGRSRTDGHSGRSRRDGDSARHRTDRDRDTPRRGDRLERHRSDGADR